MISEMKRLAKHNQYLYMQDWAKFTLEMLKDKKQEPQINGAHYWPPNNPDLNPLDFKI